MEQEYPFNIEKARKTSFQMMYGSRAVGEEWPKKTWSERKTNFNNHESDLTTCNHKTGFIHIYRYSK